MTDHDTLSIMNTINLYGLAVDTQRWDRSAKRWLIKRRTCRIVWWDRNPLAQETIPGVRFKLESSVLRREGNAGRVRYLNAISSNGRSKG